MRRIWRIAAVGALAWGASSAALADPPDLPNANLPGNSATLPNSNLPGPLPDNQPIMLPNTDTSGTAVTEAQARMAQEVRDTHDLEIRDQTMRLAARAAEESARARAEAAEARQTLQNAVEQREP